MLGLGLDHWGSPVVSRLAAADRAGTRSRFGSAAAGGAEIGTAGRRRWGRKRRQERRGF